MFNFIRKREGLITKIKLFVRDVRVHGSVIWINLLLDPKASLINIFRGSFLEIILWNQNCSNRLNDEQPIKDIEIEYRRFTTFNLYSRETYKADAHIYTYNADLQKLRHTPNLHEYLR